MVRMPECKKVKFSWRIISFDLIFQGIMPQLLIPPQWWFHKQLLIPAYSTQNSSLPWVDNAKFRNWIASILFLYVCSLHLLSLYFSTFSQKNPKRPWTKEYCSSCCPKAKRMSGNHATGMPSQQSKGKWNGCGIKKPTPLAKFINGWGR